MIDTPEKLIHAAKSVVLTSEEKSGMRARLLAHAHMNPVRKNAWAFLGRHVLASSLVLVGVLTVSTAAFAQRSLPGDFLYTIKTAVTEPVAAALTFDEDDKISVELTQLGHSIADEDTVAGNDGAMADAMRDTPTPSATATIPSGPHYTPRPIDRRPGQRGKPKATPTLSPSPSPAPTATPTRTPRFIRRSPRPVIPSILPK